MSDNSETVKMIETAKAVGLFDEKFSEVINKLFTVREGEINDVIRFAKINTITERPFNYVIDEYEYTKDLAEAYNEVEDD